MTHVHGESQMYNELYHHGILGQKWGVRRFQNRDGSYTSKGRDRHAKAESEESNSSHSSRAIRGHGGPSVTVRKSKRLAKDKQDLERLNKGEHLSYGVTKKRQAAYDARDRKKLEDRIARNESTYKKASNRKIRKDMNKTYNKMYKELEAEYKKNSKYEGFEADRAHSEAKRRNAKHLIDTYGKERMDKYYSSEHKKDVALGTAFVSSLLVGGGIVAYSKIKYGR